MLPAIFLLVIFIPAFYALIIRPQQQRQRDHEAFVAGLQVGDRVESFSGIHGTLTEVADATVRLEVAPGVVITVARPAIAGKLDPDHLEDQVTPSDDRPTQLGPDEGDLA